MSFQQYQLSLGNTPVLVTLMLPNIVILTRHESFKPTQIDYFKDECGNEFEAVLGKKKITVTQMPEVEQEIYSWNTPIPIDEAPFLKKWLQSFNM